MTSMEEESISRGEQRVKFQCVQRTATSGRTIESAEWKPLAKALMVSEELGAAPVSHDGRIFGNGALVSDGDDEEPSIIVSKSGRLAGTKYNSDEFVRVVSFDRLSWTATYESASSDNKPSSDTPLLWHSLIVAPNSFGWKKRPRFVLHGHTCASAEEAKELNIPCSPKETLFSTPDDLDALMDLLRENPYPANQIYVRLNHGFFLLADSADEAIALFQTKLCRRISR